MTTAWADLSELEQLACEYSDFFKEAHGFRPRNNVSAWTVEDFKREFAYLGRVCEANAAANAENERQAIANFTATVRKLIDLGARDEVAAISWLADAENVGNDMEFLCYKLGLPYGYFTSQ